MDNLKECLPSIKGDKAVRQYVSLHGSKNLYDKYNKNSSLGNSKISTPKEACTKKVAKITRQTKAEKVIKPMTRTVLKLEILGQNKTKNRQRGKPNY